jgi:pimeloyl-ACP methyl ester carboxylesterase
MLRSSRGSTRIGEAVSAVLRADLRSTLVQVNVPVGLIWGERDRVVPISTLDSIRGLRPDAAVATITKAAHVPQLERPEQFLAALERVLEGPSGKPFGHNSDGGRG